MAGITVNWPLRILVRSQRIAGGRKLLEICERRETMEEFRTRIRLGAKPVTALSQPLLAELPEEEARAHPLKQLAGEATAHVCESMLGAVRSTGSRAIVGDPLFTSGTGFREPGTVPSPSPGAEASFARLVQSLIATLPDTDLEALATVIAAEQEQRRGA